ncbi:MAG: hypothetical protein ACE5KV_02610 [Thermoplasmata archaeon]
MIPKRGLFERIAAVTILPLLVMPLSIATLPIAYEGKEHGSYPATEDRVALDSPAPGASTGDNPWVEIDVAVSEAQSVTVIERTEVHIEVTFNIPTLMGPGGTFSTVADEFYNIQ